MSPINSNMNYKKYIPTTSFWSKLWFSEYPLRNGSEESLDVIVINMYLMLINELLISCDANPCGSQNQLWYQEINCLLESELEVVKCTRLVIMMMSVCPSANSVLSAKSRSGHK